MEFGGFWIGFDRAYIVLQVATIAIIYLQRDREYRLHVAP